MKSSARAFLLGIIDYAGFFPPARLPLDEAIRNYSRHRAEAEGWILGRFICPAARLCELTPLCQQLFKDAAPCFFSALGRGGNSGEEFIAGVRADLEAIATFERQLGSIVSVDAFECRLPTNAHIAGASAGGSTLSEVIRVMRAQAPAIVQFYEVALGAEWQATMNALTNLLAEENQRAGADASFTPVGFKLRSGGLEAGAFPSVAHVAHALKLCREKSVPFKATAGLHHPVRRFDAELKTMMHGFLNVFGAGILAHALKLNDEQIGQVVEDEAAEDFSFSEEAFLWKNLRASTADIAAARRQFMISFGSCSFDEPRDDLRAMGCI